MSPLRESVVEDAAVSWFRALDYTELLGSSLSPGESNAERSSLTSILLEARFRTALTSLNPKVSREGIDEAFRKVSRISSPQPIEANHELHYYLVNGVSIEYLRPDGSIGYDPVRLIDFDNPENNDWLVVRQLTITEGNHTRRPDLIVFVNGLPLAVLELKNPASDNATIWDAFRQLQTYKNELPSLFVFNELLVISDGLDARIGTLSSNRERFLPWRTIDREEVAASSISKLEVLLRGVFEKRRFLDLLRYFIVFESDGEQVIKKMAGYHQFHAVARALDATIEASRPNGSRQVGVVWHTQGSGKSLTMAFYAGRVVLHPAMQNPTLIVLTDRNDLDEQLFATFARCKELLRQTPAHAQSRAELRELLKVAAGGVIFATIQLFLPEVRGDTFPCLSDRSNIVVIADEAHRSQYDFIDGFARHMRDAVPNASFIGFTGTPIDAADKNTRAVFGEYVSKYDIQRAVEDGATVPIYYESRIAQLHLSATERPHLDEKFDELTEGEELEGREKLKAKWSALEALVGAEHRLSAIAEDLLKHLDARLEVIDGKAMVVCMSRRICVELYNRLVALRPAWHSESDEQGSIKIVMTGSASDPVEWQQHVRSKGRREALAKRFKNPDDPLKLVLVRDMWLTGFDAPCVHTMYIDKPMRGHGLMQAIARVNRVYRDKPGGLVVDYLGLAEQLKQALHTYTASGGKGETALDQELAVSLMLSKYEVCKNLFHGFNWSVWTKGTPAERLSLLPPAQEHILAQEDGKQRFLQSVTELSRAFALAVPHEKAIGIRDDVGFFQAVRSAIGKTSISDRKGSGELDHAIRQIVSKAIVTDKVIDIFAAAGLKNADVSILSDEFLADVRSMPHKNLALELLRKLLNDEVKLRSKRNLTQSKVFAELLEQAVRRYQNRAIEAAHVIEELIEIAKKMREAQARGDALELTQDELAFYDALEVNDSAVAVLGDPTLRKIARELLETVKQNITIDWSVKESARAKLRVLVKRVLRKYGYPPDKQESATTTILQQAELLSDLWVQETTSTPIEPNAPSQPAVVPPVSNGATAPAAPATTTERKRELSTPEGIKRTHEKLAKVRERFFSEAPIAANAPDEKAARAGWEARLEAHDLSSGGLKIATAPLAGLPGFVRTLRVVSGAYTHDTHAANLRTKAWRVPVVASSDDYTWSSLTFDEDLGADLERLRVRGLLGNAANVFRVDAAGIGIRSATNNVSASQMYRIVVPPAFSQLALADAVELTNGWRWWEVQLPPSIDASLRSVLEQLKLSITPTELEVTCTGSSPCSYLENSRGNRYACFAWGSSLFVQVQAPGGAERNDVVAFLQGGAIEQTLPLPQGSSWMLELPQLEPGTYVFQAIAEGMDTASGRFAFSITSEMPALPSAAATLQLDGTNSALLESPSIPCDLLRFSKEPEALRFSLPPLWPVLLRWDGLRVGRSETIHADDDGSLTLALLQSRMQLWARERAGDLLLDAGELGSLKLLHESTSNAEQTVRELSSLFTERKVSIAAALGDRELLRSMWFEPLTALLGYQLTTFTESLPAAPSGVSLWRLDAVAREADGALVWSKTPLLLCPSSLDLAQKGTNTARGYAAMLCRELKCSRALLTDGLRWAVLEAQRAAGWWNVNLSEWADPPTEQEVSAFLRECGA